MSTQKTVGIGDGLEVVGGIPNEVGDTPTGVGDTHEGTMGDVPTCSQLKK